ncbi:phasin family protein [Paenirhodobacter sp.]|uniref:phasin family protein n=1 Tax=Paenirhodobacter sp. TaxID=1965326 RepID=UPI003B416000
MTRKTPTDMMGSFSEAFKNAPLPDWTALVKPQARVAEAMLRHNIETLEFLKARCERDRDFLAALGRAESPTDAIGLWQGFWQKMLADYASETDKLAASAATLAQETIRSATDGAGKGKAE